ncbi:uncharacterized protein LOC142981645 [Anticarsia gemmatalis]|uniref:uncharacterized protein LOC142981645 n=1 Tax=Anticarsia gemmatalis TaxID=129554 RepID=UPI003F761BA6
MTKIIFALICTVIFALTMSANTRMDNMSNNRGSMGSMGSTTTAMDQDSSSNESKELDMEMIMNDCNETFRIEMAYLESLNESGSFLDETDKTPKCFIRCMLENMGVVSVDDHMFNPARAAVLFAGKRNGKLMEDIGDMTALCADRKETCPCERAYNFMRCLMSMEIEKYESSN